ncbi:MAG TPA: hypothetical protein PK760_11180, partial [Flavobacteriales bacterium]|nr:hypothetical protein [Flavobacteriales bacterium]
KEFLDTHCGDTYYGMCAWKDRLPRMAYQFHWDPNGPAGGMGGWSKVRDEYGDIIRASITEGRFLLRHIQVSLRATIAQLQLSDIGDGWGSFKEGSDVHYALTRHMRHDMRTMEASRQYQERLGLVPIFIPIHRWVVRISLVALLPLLWVAFRERRGTLLAIACATLASIVLNAWGSATFSGEVDRFGCKMIWMLPLLAMLIASTVIKRAWFDDMHAPEQAAGA